MRVFFTVVVFAAVAFSATAAEDVSLDNPDGAVDVQSPPATIFTDSDAVPWVQADCSPVAHPERDEGSGGWPEYDWDNDILVSSSHVGSGQDFDIDPANGDIYAIYDTGHATQDSVIVYRSQDGGATWTFWQRSYDPSGEMNNPRIRVVRDTSGQSYVCMFFLNDNHYLIMQYIATDLSASGWTTVTSSDVIYYDVDGEADNSGWLYATYVVAASGNDIWVARCSIDNHNWVDHTMLFNNPQMIPYPSIAAAVCGTVSVAFLDDRLTTNQNIRIRRSTDYGATWSLSVQVGDNTEGYDLSWTSMAYNYATADAGWIFATCEDTGTGDDLVYYYTTNAGSSWTYGQTIGGPGDQNMPNVRCRKAGSAVTLAFNSDPGDSTMFSWATGSFPNYFTAPERINDFYVTGSWPPTAGWTGSMPAVLYSGGYTGLLFDWFGNTGIEDQPSATCGEIIASPNPFTTTASISFSVTGSESVSVSIYNISGRLVKTIVDNQYLSAGDHSVQWNGVDYSGASVAPGVYFCRLNIGASVLSTRLVMVP